MLSQAMQIVFFPAQQKRLIVVLKVFMSPGLDRNTIREAWVMKCFPLLL